VRHGESTGNVEQKVQGQIDTDLTKAGVSQAKSLRDKLKRVHFDKVYSSDLCRARRTAEIITLERKLAVITTKALRERSFGKHQGKTYEQFNKTFAAIRKKIESLPHDKRFKTKFDKEVESDEEFVSRFIVYLRQISVANPKKTILVAAHGGVLRMLLIHLGWGTYDQLPPGTVKNTGYIKLLSDGVDFFVQKTFGVNKQ